MYIAMNRFKVRPGSEEEFENIWKNRETRLPQMKGFKSFHLLRGPQEEGRDHTLFASHTVWESKEDFIAWTKSQNFRDNHRSSGSGKVLTDGHPQFEGFSVVEGA
ncbi:antibiotic biosynthesis monooxygenase family protein [Pontibaca methylaminivorans]|uniref:Heme-degrading monooxygenase HmoA n=1 Tax=Pontibaca methylaminivorans TaxID=515897 RepID=A0A1R3XB34_9RHOB|nr:antibiotic biosynthesis monooxygenase [Pontibaca methylaminivorans]SIT86749.1 Heme-degrading monooxygenase HmoA [Pontibaca methylaminivorans]